MHGLVSQFQRGWTVTPALLHPAQAARGHMLLVTAAVLAQASVSTVARATSGTNALTAR